MQIVIDDIIKSTTNAKQTLYLIFIFFKFVLQNFVQIYLEIIFKFTDTVGDHIGVQLVKKNSAIPVVIIFHES